MNMSAFLRFSVVPSSLRYSVCTSRRPICTSSVALSGHNKWSKIKEKKGINDQLRGKMYARATKEIMTAVRTGGSVDPEVNASLAATLKRVKAQGVPKENIENALKKVAGGSKAGDQYLTYEAIAPGSVGLIIECQSDNVNRTLHSVRSTLTDHGARLAPVKFMFERRGAVKVAVDREEGTGDKGLQDKLDKLIEATLEAGAEDFKEIARTSDSVTIEFECQTQDLAKLTATAMDTGLCRELLSSEMIFKALEKASSLDPETENQVDGLIEKLEDDDDVLSVWSTHQ
ncbi:DUF28-domain-containing protein [Wolfiporia cocos MD-104 SS10]|uniref:DUF28-domain-containing protein n=1 Tax=Wolfiporia cocos (strain MD-104) TaxID=742152 RepID=A0A2H3JHY6_WOLCO|nr:DUF28-domain-containing protein [Wolfiporia cocos MD-104 SS10]